MAAATAAKEVIWLPKLLTDLEYQYVSEVVLYVDNQSTIRLSKNPEFHKRTKHIDIQYHFLREKSMNGEIDIKYVPTESQIADVFTKPLARDRFRMLCENMNVQSVAV